MKKTRSYKINYTELYKRFSRNEISPVYIFSGNQAYLMDEAISELKKITVGASSDFNFSLFYSDSNSAREIVETAKTYPMLSRMRLVVVKNADRFSDSELGYLDSYISSPSPSTCLVLIAEEEKDLSLENKKGVVYVDFALDTKDISKQIILEAKKLGCEITKEAVETLISLVGDKLQDIHRELQKLALFVGNRIKIGAEDVEKLTAKELIDKNVPQDEILKQLRTSSGAFYYIRQEAKNFSYNDIKRINQALYDCDRTLKTAYIPKNLTLTKFILELCS